MILRKLEYFREGGSSKHLRDVRSILDVSDDTIERPFLEGEIANRSLGAAWAAVMASG